MKHIDEIAVIVQARMNSKRVPQKMVRPFAGTTLMDICLEKLTRSTVIPKQNIYISVFEPELRDIAVRHGLQIYDRSELSANAESSLTEIYEWHDKLPQQYKYIILINACSPFLEIATVDKFVQKYMEIEQTGLFGVIHKKNYYWNKSGVMVTPWPVDQTIMNTKAVEVTYEAAHCLYASRIDTIKDDVFMGSFKQKDDPVLFPMDDFEVFDIDYEWQFCMAEAYYGQLYCQNVAE